MTMPSHYREGTCSECQHYRYGDSLCTLWAFWPEQFGRCDDYLSGIILDFGEVN